MVPPVSVPSKPPKLVSDRNGLRPEAHAWTFTPAEIADAIGGRRLLNPSMDLSNVCSLNCNYCFIERTATSAKRRLKNELSLDESLWLLQEFARMGARTVNLVGAGEPTQDPHFVEIIEEATRLNMRVMLFTNGIAFADNAKLVDWLSQREVTVALKYNSSDPRIQDAMVRRAGYTKLRNEALRQLLIAGFADRLPTRLAIDFILTNSVLSEGPHLYRWCREHNVHPIFADYIPTGRTAKISRNIWHSPRLEGDTEMHGLSLRETKAMSDALATIDREFDVPPNQHGCAYYGGNGCTQLLGLYVDIQGHLWPCVARQTPEGSSEPLGSIRDRAEPSIQDIWENHPSMVRIRSQYTGACPYRDHRDRASVVKELESAHPHIAPTAPSPEGREEPRHAD